MMPQILHNTFLLCLGTLGLLKASHASPTKPAGLIDLGYAKHIPTYVNTTESGRNISVYKNIRFANSPTGDLRFRLPDTNIPDIEGVQDGNFPPTTFDCISSAPKEAPFPPLNGTTWGQEDCLFLDVYVPDNVKPGDSVPVLHFFVGSGFAFGSKDIFVLPNGLFDVTDDENKFIFVANNYRYVHQPPLLIQSHHVLCSPFVFRLLTGPETRRTWLVLPARRRHGCQCWDARLSCRSRMDGEVYFSIRR